MVDVSEDEAAEVTARKRIIRAFAPDSSLRSERTPVCYGYARVSADPQAEYGLRLNGQGSEIDSYYGRVVAPRSIPFRQTVVDAVTASEAPFARRDVAARLVEVLEPGDHVIFSKVDLAFRDVIDCVESLHDLAEMGVVAHIVELDFDSSDEQRLLRGAAELLQKPRFAREHAATLSARATERNVIRRLKGLYRGGAIAPGFKLGGPKGRKRLVPNEEERQVMRYMAELHDSGMNYYKIERHLVKERLMRAVRDRTAYRGRRLEFWTHQSIRRAVEQIREIDRQEAEGEASQAAGVGQGSNERGQSESGMHAT